MMERQTDKQTKCQKDAGDCVFCFLSLLKGLKPREALTLKCGQTNMSKQLTKNVPRSELNSDLHLEGGGTDHLLCHNAEF